MNSPPERIEQSDVHEDAVRAFKVLATKAAMIVVVPVLAALLAIWWRLG
ncbi:MAG: hypothetical protein AB7L90_03325 [Hyphomicrobiaceae bacterium]